MSLNTLPVMKQLTFDRAMKESTATAVNMMVGISMTTAEPMLVLKKVIVANQPLIGNKQGKHNSYIISECN